MLPQAFRGQAAKSRAPSTLSLKQTQNLRVPDLLSLDVSVSSLDSFLQNPKLIISTLNPFQNNLCSPFRSANAFETVLLQRILRS